MCTSSRVAQIATAVSLGDLVVPNAAYDPANPLHSFVRHYRNACAHGDRWEFRRDSLDRGARFMDIEVGYSMNGSRATNSVSPLRHVQLLQAVSDEFGPPARPAAR